MDTYIQPAGGDYAAIRALFGEYTQTPGVIETCYKSYEQERDTLPGEFAEPHGRLTDDINRVKVMNANQDRCTECGGLKYFCPVRPRVAIKI